jgi:hypothetical protein
MNNKKIIIAVAIVTVLALGYYFFVYKKKSAFTITDNGKTTLERLQYWATGKDPKIMDVLSKVTPAEADTYFAVLTTNPLTADLRTAYNALSAKYGIQIMG